MLPATATTVQPYAYTWPQLFFIMCVPGVVALFVTGLPVRWLLLVKLGLLRPVALRENSGAGGVDHDSCRLVHRNLAYRVEVFQDANCSRVVGDYCAAVIGITAQVTVLK